MPAAQPESPAAQRALLESGISRLGLRCDADVIGALLDYLALLARWNNAYNLTAVREPRQMVLRHLLDALAVLPHIGSGNLLDVGSGGGLPGVPLALCLPQSRVSLLDSNGKKTRFLFQVKQALSLENVSIEQQRAEVFRPRQRFDTVIARAFASLSGMLDSCSHLVGPTGRLVAMKGEYPEAEIAAVQARCRRLEVVTLAVPDLAEQRHLVIMNPAAGTAD